MRIVAIVKRRSLRSLVEYWTFILNLEFMCLCLLMEREKDGEDQIVTMLYLPGDF